MITERNKRRSRIVAALSHGMKTTVAVASDRENMVFKVVSYTMCVYSFVHLQLRDDRVFKNISYMYDTLH